MVGRRHPLRAGVYGRLDRALTELQVRIGGLPSPQETQPIWDDIWHEETHHSTALEGNSLDLREVQALLDGGRALGSKPLREYNAVLGYADAARWVYSQAVGSGGWQRGRLICVDEVRRMHHTAMTPLWNVAPDFAADNEEEPGQFRRRDTRLFVGGTMPAPWHEVPARLDAWTDDVCETGERLGAGQSSQLPLPEELARLHNGFERVHPFFDGNGRVGRLLLNTILVRLGYPPVIILKRQREAYLTALQRADTGNYAVLGELIAQAMCTTIEKFVVPVVGSGRGSFGES